HRVARPARKHALDEVDVGVIDTGAPLPLSPLRHRRVVPEPRKATKGESVGAEDASGKILLDVFRHSLDDRHDGDEEHHADGHAKESEEALELLDPDRVQSESDSFEEEFHGASRWEKRSSYS